MTSFGELFLSFGFVTSNSMKTDLLKLSRFVKRLVKSSIKSSIKVYNLEFHQSTTHFF